MNWQMFLIDQAITVVIGLLRQLVGSETGQAQYVKVMAKIFVSIWQVFSGNQAFLDRVTLLGFDPMRGNDGDLYRPKVVAEATEEARPKTEKGKPLINEINSK